MPGPATVAYRRIETPSGAVQEKLLDAGQNPPDGVIIHYWLRDTADSVRLSIRDAHGNEVRSFTDKRDQKATSEAHVTTAVEVQQTAAEDEVTESDPEAAGPC